MSLGKAVCLQSLNPLKHLPAFTGLSFIFLFIIPGLLYGKCGTSLHSEKQLRLTNKQTDKLKDNKACGQTSWWSDSEPGLIVWSQPCFHCHEPPFMWDKLTHCWRAQCLQHLFSNSECIVIVICSPFILNVKQLPHIMVSLLCGFIHIWEAMWRLRCWWTLEECWKACVIRPLISVLLMFGLLCPFSSLCVLVCAHVCWAWGTLMESNVCVMLGSLKWNGVGVGGPVCCHCSELAAIRLWGRWSV